MNVTTVVTSSAEVPVTMNNQLFLMRSTRVLGVEHIVRPRCGGYAYMVCEWQSGPRGQKLFYVILMQIEAFMYKNVQSSVKTVKKT